MGRLKEVCGAVSGAFMAAGLFRGDYDVTDADTKAAFYDYIHGMGDMFKAEYGSLLCRELHTEDLDEFKRPCINYVGYMARILAESLYK
jgi:C_GCAxxG_C_C family probable redox protein